MISHLCVSNHIEVVEIFFTLYECEKNTQYETNNIKKTKKKKAWWK